jgi:serine O-acetyltransferase
MRRRVTFADTRALIASDLYRYAGRMGFWTYCRYAAAYPGFNFSVWLRLAAWTRSGRAARLLSPFIALVKRHYSLKYDIWIPRLAEIGPGLHIAHLGGIVVHGDCTIGRDCNISHGVTLALANRGPRAGVPVIGDRVYIGPGAKLVGAITVGSDVAIGANAVVTHDLPDGAVAAGVPAKIISHAGSADYVVRTDYHLPRLEGW